MLTYLTATTPSYDCHFDLLFLAKAYWLDYMYIKLKSRRKNEKERRKKEKK
jgi:hypothetical protein